LALIGRLDILDLLVQRLADDTRVAIRNGRAPRIVLIWVDDQRDAGVAERVEPPY